MLTFLVDYDTVTLCQHKVVKTFGDIWLHFDTMTLCRDKVVFRTLALFCLYKVVLS